MKDLILIKNAWRAAGRVVLLFIALCFGALLPHAAAQGILSGVNLAGLRLDEPVESGMDYTTLTGFKAGMVVEVPLGNSNFSVLAQPMYVQRGAMLELPVMEPMFEVPDVELNLDYFALPVLGKYAFGQSTARPYVVFGPELGFLLKAEQDGYDVKDNFEKLDFLATLGAGLDYQLTDRLSVFVEGRYDYGLSNLNTVADSQVKLYNQGMQIMVGAKMPLWKQEPEDLVKACECASCELRLVGVAPLTHVNENQDVIIQIYFVWNVDVLCDTPPGAPCKTHVKLIYEKGSLDLHWPENTQRNKVRNVLRAGEGRIVRDPNTGENIPEFVNEEQVGKFTRKSWNTPCNNRPRTHEINILLELTVPSVNDQRQSFVSQLSPMYNMEVECHPLSHGKIRLTPKIVLRYAGGSVIIDEQRSDLDGDGKTYDKDNDYDKDKRYDGDRKVKL